MIEMKDFFEERLFIVSAVAVSFFILCKLESWLRRSRRTKVYSEVLAYCKDRDVFLCAYCYKGKKIQAYIPVDDENRYAIKLLETGNCFCDAIVVEYKYLEEMQLLKIKPNAKIANVHFK